MRFMYKLTIGDDCWEWSGGTGSHGYGQFYVEEVNRNCLAHRVSYELFVGEIPEGLTIDHLCRNKLCVKPSHLEPCTREENARRAATKVVCLRGHNDRRAGKTGKRYCVPCSRTYSLEYQARKRALSA